MLTTVSELDPIRVRFSISERDYLSLVAKFGPPDEAKKEARRKEKRLELFLADGSKHPHEGTFGFAGREIDPKTGSLTIETTFPNPTRTIKPGQFARVRTTIEMRKNAPLVPQRAVRELQGIYQIVVVNEQNVAEVRQLKLGVRVGDLWLVEQGVDPGEKVAVAALHRVRDGMTVVPVSPEETAKSPKKGEPGK